MVASYISVENKRPVAIIGAGVNGLSVANILLDRGYPVTIYASCYPPNTASNISPYLWEPAKAPRDDQKDLYKKLNELSYLHFRDLTASASPEYRGVTMIPVYTFGASDAIKAEHKDVKDVSVTFCSGRSYKGFQWCTIAIDTDLYVCDLFRKAQEKGAYFVPRTIKNKGDLLSLKETIIVNCSGVGAKEVSGDTTVIPVCTKFMTFEPQPSIEYAAEVFEGDNRLFFYVPGSYRLSLGVITSKGDKACDADEVKGHKLVKNAQDFFAFP